MYILIFTGNFHSLFHLMNGMDGEFSRSIDMLRKYSMFISRVGLTGLGFWMEFTWNLSFVIDTRSKIESIDHYRSNATKSKKMKNTFWTHISSLFIRKINDWNCKLQSSRTFVITLKLSIGCKAGFGAPLGTISVEKWRPEKFVLGSNCHGLNNWQRIFFFFKTEKKTIL